MSWRLRCLWGLLAVWVLACSLPSVATPGAVEPPAEPTARVAPPVSPTPTRVPPASPGSGAGEVLPDVVYCSPDGVDVTLDLYFPPEEVPRPWPVALYIHGGAWIHGDKRRGAGYVEVEPLRQAGFAVAAVNYRLAPAFTFPAMIEDVKCAVRFLRAHAAEYGLDPQRVGVWGGSAGGHLAALLGTSDATAGWDVGPYLEQSSRVQAVVDMFGPTDLPTLFAATESPEKWLTIFGATSLQDPVLVAASPVYQVTSDDPPFLILHGDQDQVVPPEQSQILFEALQEAGVPAELVWVHHAGHGFVPQGGPLDPPRQEITRRVVAFFRSTLLGAAP